MSEMTPSNTDTELSRQIDKALLLVELDYKNERFLKPGDLTTVKQDILDLIARRDTEKSEALLKAVGEDAKYDLPLGSPDRLAHAAQNAEKARFRQAIESIYGGEE